MEGEVSLTEVWVPDPVFPAYDFYWALTTAMSDFVSGYFWIMAAVVAFFIGFGNFKKSK